MDSLIAVKLIQDMDVDRSIYLSLIKETRYLMSIRETCIIYISHSQNKVSDSIAKFARLEARTMTWLDFGPQDAINLAVIDCKDLLS